MKIALLAAALLIGAAVPVIAADAAVDEVVVVDRAYDWSGVYVGVDVGYAFGQSEVYFADLINVPFNVSLEPEGFVGGMHLGANYQLASRFVVGLEADLLYNSLDDDTVGIAGSAGAALGMGVEGDVKWSGSARVRAGYAIDRILPFVTAGVAAAEYEVSLFPTDTPQFRATRENTYVGWTVGAGIEYALTDNWLGRIEYRYSDFGSEPFDPGMEEANDVDLKTQDIRVGLSYKF